ncbi:MAG: FMN-binding protein, partial [Clostridiales bacterium]|nr:FMN-binding protein [Clostridiales bacterium]
KAAADAALKTVLENASSFEEIDVSSLGFATIKSASTGYSADSNVCGRAYILSAKGYKGGEIKIAVGIVDGKIVKVQTIDCSTQTVGFGSKVGEEWFTSGFDGASADSIGNVDIISGATISSTAYKNAIKDALEADRIISEKGR